MLDTCIADDLRHSISPPAVDVEMRALYSHDEDNDGLDLLKRMLFWLSCQLRTGRNFEVTQGYLCRFLAIYSEKLLKVQSLAEDIHNLKDIHTVSCDSFRTLVQSNLCLLKVMARLPIA